MFSRYDLDNELTKKRSETSTVATALPETMPRHANAVVNDDDALLQVCGSEQMATKVRVLWTEMMEKQKLDVSDQGLNNDTVQKLIKGLHMCARAA